ncbi:CDP-glycerol glycerophosphotransferase family protein [Mammaliicoccus sciuri]|uniref:CDP-glycerol glycerophosphotransferase family protein n=1 Tax=Mammaliicoccus sciuri TaxID=1296 RepID=UPI001C3E664A|nr:CDP-glycerol glycerophosphotransferase family protein [Mammaliicoccus sciuri]MBV5105666.1 CDP-glycerol glycerophosphotransferase family protein [Mammaliicoccus sciuri]
MIKIINIHDQHNLEKYIIAECREENHIILIDRYTQVREEVLNNLELDNQSYMVDYTNSGYYTNDSRYMGKAFITVADWFNNITLQPNIIFKKDELLWLISNYKWETIFDITLNAIFHLDEIKIDPHVIFDYVHQSKPSANCLAAFKHESLSYEEKFYLNKFALLNGITPLFKAKETRLPSIARTIDKVMLKSQFQLPKIAYQKLNHTALQKQMKAINIYDKDQSKIKPHIVFLGFDYGYRGNSKYLFEYLVKQHPKYTVYFITDQKKGDHFVSPSHSDTKQIIEEANVVILESYLPDDFKPNGTIIQLWHGTPLKRLFLDSKEPKQNIDIYNYRARKYNKLIKQDYFITDVESINNVFKSAFPLEETEIVACGYPRNEYLLEQHSNSNEINKIKQQLNLNTEKETILYTPTWRDNQEEEFLLEFTDEMKAKYNIIYKYHEEDHANKQHNYIDTRQFETQQLLLVSDIVISDYSSIVFDALTIDKKVYLYTPDFNNYDYNRGLYKEVYETINDNQYFEQSLLFNAIMNDDYHTISDQFINKNNQSYEIITQLIEQAMD